MLPIHISQASRLDPEIAVGKNHKIPLHIRFFKPRIIRSVSSTNDMILVYILKLAKPETYLFMFQESAFQIEKQHFTPQIIIDGYPARIRSQSRVSR